MKLKKNQYYKGLNENYRDIQTNLTLYEKGKVISIPKDKQNDKLCSDGVLHASKNIFDIFEFVHPKTFAIVEGTPIVTDDKKYGFYEYKVIKILTNEEISKIMNCVWDLRPVTTFFTKEVKPTKEDLKLLKEWDSVWGSVRGSVWDSVWDSVRDSVRGSVWDSVWGSVRGSVWGSVRGSVWDSVWGSVWDSVWGSVYAYIGSLFPNVKKWKYTEKLKVKGYPFDSANKLIRKGLMPCTDGKYWYLLSGKDFKVVYKIKKEDL
jgi:hypothetical protein